MLTGENGLLNKATNAGEKTEMKNADEAMKLVATEWKIEKNTGKMTIDEFLTSKVPNELDAYEKISDNEYELEKDGYVLVIDADGNILDDMCYEKLLVCDICVVVTPEHIGKSTTNRIKQAFELGKPVYLWENGNMVEFTPNMLEERTLEK